MQGSLSTMFSAFWLKLINRVRHKNISGFVVEKLTNSQASGWLALEDGLNPEEQNFQVIEKGVVIGTTVRLFYRPDFVKQKKDNLFGFRLHFQQSLSQVNDTSIFYINENVRIEPTLLTSVESYLSDSKSTVYFLNKMISQAKLNAENLPSFDLLKLLTTNKTRAPESIESKMTDLLTDEISEFYLRAGLQSKCGVAITGKSGHLFLHGGSNNVDELFQNNNLHREKTPLWLALFAKRVEKAKISGYQYVQIVIPEKQSLLDEFYYKEIETPSKLLNDIEKTKEESYFSVLKSLSQYPRNNMFFKSDSHLNANGTFLLFKEIMKHLSIDITLVPKFDKKRQVSGDLGGKFHPFTMSEYVNITADLAASDRQVKYQFIPDNKAHMGRHIYWINPKAPVKKKVLLFGNSFCDIGTKQQHLTWWFSHYFEECQFVWSNDFNEKLIAAFEPDIVIGQTIERFLRLVPKC